MSNTRKVYPAKPPRVDKKAPRYGDPEFPKVTPEELAKAREVFWDIFMVKHDSDCFNDFAIAIGGDRNRAKQLYYFILFQKGFMQNQQARERKVRGKLAVRIKKYTEFLENPETIYQILARAEDEVDKEEEQRRQVGETKC